MNLLNEIAERRIGVLTSQLLIVSQQQPAAATAAQILRPNQTASAVHHHHHHHLHPHSPQQPQQRFYSAMNNSNNHHSVSLFGQVPLAPPDPILGLSAAFKQDTDPRKVNLGVGAYRDEAGKPYVLPLVRKVEQRIANDTSLNKEYIPQDGLAEFKEQTVKILLGADSPAIREGRTCVVQSLSGTGALRLAFEFFARFLPKGTKTLVSDPTWGNHFNVIAAAGLTYGKYRYLLPDKTLDFAGMMEDIENAPDGSVVLLHLCAHNPSGADPTHEQWQQIGQLVKRKKMIPFFDSAYQGFASGDLDNDAYAIRHFVHDLGLEALCSQSYAKNFGLYGERIGALNFVCNNREQADHILSQMMVIVRTIYSSPQLHGARIVAMTLQDPQLTDEWKRELRKMSGRINDMRRALYDALKKRNIPGKWECILNQIGMFSMIPLNPQQCKVMIDKHHIYMTSNGRISMAGLNASNVDYVADAIADVVANQ